MALSRAGYISTLKKKVETFIYFLEILLYFLEIFIYFLQFLTKTKKNYTINASSQSSYTERRTRELHTK